jgi:hypothetical protein
MGCDLRLTKSKMPLVIKILLLIGGIYTLLFAVWLILFLNSEAPPDNAVTMSSFRGFTVNEMSNQGVKDSYGEALPVNNGNMICGYSVIYETDETESFIYLYSPDERQTLDSIEIPGHSSCFMKLDSGNFAFMLTDDGKNYLCEYTSDLEFVSKCETDISFRPKNFYYEGCYYTGAGKAIEIFDNNLNSIKKYSTDDFPGSLILSFIRSYDGTPYIYVQYFENTFLFDRYKSIPERNEIYSIDGNENVSFSLGDGRISDIYGPYQGDELYSFYLMSNTRFPALRLLFFGFDVQGDYIYGINADGSYDKIFLVYNQPNDRMYNFYSGFPHNSKRYKAATEDSFKTLTFDLIEYETYYSE